MAHIPNKSLDTVVCHQSQTQQPYDLAEHIVLAVTPRTHAYKSVIFWFVHWGFPVGKKGPQGKDEVKRIQVRGAFTVQGFR